MKNENKLIKDSRYAETLVHFYYFNMTILIITFYCNITYKHLLPEFSEINNCLFEKKISISRFTNQHITKTPKIQ